MLCHGFHGKIFVEVSRHPCRQIGEAAGGSNLKLQRLGELLLPPGPLHVDHQFARHGKGHAGSEVFFNQCQGKINPGGDARRGVELAVPNVESIGIHLQRRKAAGQLGGELPVSGHSPPVEQSGRRYCKSTGAHRGNTTNAVGSTTDPIRQLRSRRREANAAAARNEKRVHVAQGA